LAYSGLLFFFSSLETMTMGSEGGVTSASAPAAATPEGGAQLHKLKEELAHVMAEEDQVNQQLQGLLDSLLQVDGSAPAAAIPVRPSFIIRTSLL